MARMPNIGLVRWPCAKAFATPPPSHGSPVRELGGTTIAITALVPLGTARIPALANPYPELKRLILEARLLDPRPLRSALLIAGNVGTFAGLFAVLAFVHAGWAVCLVAIGLGVMSGQLGFQLHDSGHRQMFRSRGLNSAVSFVTANVLLGMSSGWWIDKHNRHHGNPNHVDLDPDIAVGMVSYSTEQALAKRGVARYIAAHQAYFFFPLLFGLGWAMHLNGVRFLIERRNRAAAVEGITLLAHAVAYLAVLVLLAGPWLALAVVVIQKCVGGFYMASVFAPNHKGMPQVETGQRLDFLRSQVLTARNVRSHRVTDFIYGGLNYQIEHHLFPTMPRSNVPAAHRIIRQFCAEVPVEYYETSIIQSYREILSFLDAVGAPLRVRRPAVA